MGRDRLKSDIERKLYKRNFYLKYYQLNKEKLKKKNLENYYKRKNENN
jgi:hypothetical protein